jgi:hypothetical protein
MSHQKQDRLRTDETPAECGRMRDPTLSDRVSAGVDPVLCGIERLAETRQPLLSAGGLRVA